MKDNRQNNFLKPSISNISYTSLLGSATFFHASHIASLARKPNPSIFKLTVLTTACLLEAHETWKNVTSIAENFTGIYNESKSKLINRR